MKELILEIKWSGLGDHLLWSHIPRIAKQFGGYDRVYISTHSLFRSDEIIKFVWKTNPFVDGIEREKGESIGDFKKIEKDMNLLDKIMLLLGFDDGMRFHEPELYYRPVIRKDLAEAVIYDPNYIARAGNITTKRLERFRRENNIQLTHQMRVLSRCNCISLRRNRIRENKQNLCYIDTLTLEEFSSVIISCKKMFCLTTGTATLAAALHKSVTVLYGREVLRMAHHSPSHRYICLS